VWVRLPLSAQINTYIIMKKILILPMLLLLSCVDITRSEPQFIETDIISRYHRDSETIYEYHYGYNVFESKYEFYYGPNTIPEVNEVTFVFFGKSLTYDDERLFNESKIRIKYLEVYYDGIFHHNRILSVRPAEK
jgi:hypothetical protein